MEAISTSELRVIRVMDLYRAESIMQMAMGGPAKEIPPVSIDCNAFILSAECSAYLLDKVTNEAERIEIGAKLQRFTTMNEPEQLHFMMTECMRIANKFRKYNNANCKTFVQTLNARIENLSLAMQDVHRGTTH